jgi:DNA adenine methylase
MLIRYPGSKDRQAGRLSSSLDLTDRRLCEPFCGTAAVTFACLRNGWLDHVWLNDADRGITDLWSTVRDDPAGLISQIAAYQPSADSFYELRDREFDSPADNAFATVVLHQISYSGLGRKAGSPIGGRDQSGSYKVGCRWNAARLTTGIQRAHDLLAKVHVTITNLDWTDCPEWAWYVDPPYVAAGSSLYRRGVFPVEPLRDHLRGKAEWWSLSYDDVPEIRAAYDWAVMDRECSTYLGRGRQAELLITPRHPVHQLF